MSKGPTITDYTVNTFRTVVSIYFDEQKLAFISKVIKFMWKKIDVTCEQPHITYSCTLSYFLLYKAFAYIY